MSEHVQYPSEDDLERSRDAVEANRIITKLRADLDKSKAALAAAEKRLREIREVWAQANRSQHESHAAMFRQEVASE